MLETNEAISELRGVFYKASETIFHRTEALRLVGMGELASIIEFELELISEKVVQVNKVFSREITQRFRDDQKAAGETITALLRASEKK